MGALVAAARVRNATLLLTCLPLNGTNFETVYGGGAGGYTDYAAAN